MECNKDEAVRAKAIADMKLEKQDYPGAKKFVLKAQSLYPQLDGLSQLMTTVDVYISAANKVGGEMDWYGVLGISHTADDDTVRKQYRKLALMLHPDKNKSPGADGAFKLICEAWSLLSDKSKRLAYNQRRWPAGFSQNVSTRTSSSSVPPQANGFYSYGSRPSSAPKANQNNAQVPRTSVPRTPLSVPRTPLSVPRPPASTSRSSASVPSASHHRSDTFWTICKECKMHYEYLKKYLNHTLLCPNCRKAFVASEAPPPSNYTRPSNSTSRQRQPNSSNHAPAGNPPFQAGRNAPSVPKGSGPPGPAGVQSSKYTNVQRGSHSQTTAAGRVDPSIAAKASNVVQQAQERMKRERDASQTAAGWEGKSGYSSTLVGEGLYKKARLNEDGLQHGANVTHNRFNADGYTNLSSNSAQRKSGVGLGVSSFSNKLNGTRELTPVETRDMLMEKARKVILEKVNELKPLPKTKDLNRDNKLKVKEREKEKERIPVTGPGHELNGTVKSSESLISDKEDPIVKEDPVVPQMDVPDADFHVFDQDRSESCFGENEVWASYDDDDGMPRFYAKIHSVISLEPFKLKISWLNSKTNTEFGTMDWVNNGFYKTCGEFRSGKYEVYKSVNAFSHKVQWSKGRNGVIQIFPKKGDVWALYRHWSSDWNEQIPDEVIHQYDMFVVLDDYNEQQGVSVAPLVKVAGFKTVFLPHSDPEKVWRIPKEEMFRFSHQVPHYMLTGEEAQNVPKGSLELDPAATPLELLEVFTENGDDVNAKDENS